MYYVYVLLSSKDNKFYTGLTDDLKRRLAEHNAGQVQSTSQRRPLRLVYYEACLNQNDAVNREKYLKTTFGKEYIRKRISNFLVETGVNT
jgi:putative endonuclease